MSGWISVAIIVFAEIAAAALLLRIAARRWWDFLAISVLTVALVRPTEHYVTGDVSRYLPTTIWSDSSEGKDQIIHASAVSTILLPLIVSAIAAFLFSQTWRALKRTGGHN